MSVVLEFVVIETQLRKAADLEMNQHWAGLPLLQALRKNLGFPHAGQKERGLEKGLVFVSIE